VEEYESPPLRILKKSDICKGGNFMLIINGKIFTMTGKPVDCGYICKQPLSAASRAAFPGQSGPY